MLWERGPKEHPLLGDCPLLGVSFINTSDRVLLSIDKLFEHYSMEETFLGG